MKEMRMLLLFIVVLHSGGTNSWANDSISISCKIFDPWQAKLVNTQWTGKCSSGITEGVGTAKWMAPSTIFKGKQFPYQYDGEVSNGRFNGNGRWVTDRVALSGKFYDGNVCNGKCKMFGQLVPLVNKLISGKSTTEEALSISPLLEFDCSNGSCSNQGQVDKIQREKLETVVFGAAGAAIGLYIIKEGVGAIGRALVDTRSDTGASSSNRNCKNMWHECWDFCDSVMNKNNGGILTSSDKEKCVYRCNEAKTACNEGAFNKTNQYRCEAKCEMLQDENGDFFTFSSRDTCRNNCFSKYN